ncbi:hypothetical protein D3C73_521320 [compost metagenome]
MCHVFKQGLVLGKRAEQLLSAVPGPGQVIQRQAQIEFLAQALSVVGLQNAPMVQELLGQVVMLIGDGNVNALLQPGRVGLRVLELIEFIEEHLRGLLASAVSQQAVKRQLGKLALLSRLLAVFFQLQIDIRRQPRFFASQMPLSSRLQRLCPQAGITLGNFGEDPGCHLGCLQRQRQTGKILQLRQ